MKPVKEQKTSKTMSEELLYGKKKKLILPSGFYVVIREQNGHDDDIISNKATANDLSNLSIFLSSLIIETNLPFANNGKVTIGDIDQILLRDKYYILFASRVHSMGEGIIIKYNWGEDNGGELEYEENLNIFLWDFSKPFPEEGSVHYLDTYIKPYPKDPYGDFYLTLDSGKEIAIELLTGKGEKYLINLSINKQTRNQELIARNLRLKNNIGEWDKVSNFMFFNKKDMSQIHSLVKKADPNFAGLVELSNPNNGEIQYYPVMFSQSFFYPEEI